MSSLLLRVNRVRMSCSYSQPSMDVPKKYTIEAIRGLEKTFRARTGITKEDDRIQVLGLTPCVLNVPKRPMGIFLDVRRS